MGGLFSVFQKSIIGVSRGHDKIQIKFSYKIRSSLTQLSDTMLIETACCSQQECIEDN